MDVVFAILNFLFLMLQSKNYITGTGISRGDANKLREDSLSFVLGELQVNAL